VYSFSLYFLLHPNLMHLFVCHLYQLKPHLVVNFNLFGGAASF
jgi:hypothetical protein